MFVRIANPEFDRNNNHERSAAFPQHDAQGRTPLFEIHETDMFPKKNSDTVYRAVQWATSSATEVRQRQHGARSSIQVRTSAVCPTRVDVTKDAALACVTCGQVRFVRSILCCSWFLRFADQRQNAQCGSRNDEKHDLQDPHSNSTLSKKWNSNANRNSVP